jgi:Zn-dependent peptidase ImmA (M78 family)
MSSPYYEGLKLLAVKKREQYGLTTDKINLTAIKAIYRAEGILIDPWKLKPRIRAVYMCEGGDPSVMLNDSLPKEPRLFTLAHELKHHYCDQATLAQGHITCGDYNANREIEVGGEIFAAEFIYPEAEFLKLVDDLGMAQSIVSPEDIVRFKRATPAKVSYQFLRKRFEFFDLAPKGRYAKVKFTILEAQMFGPPLYKQGWFQQLRARRAAGR